MAITIHTLRISNDFDRKGILPNRMNEANDQFLRKVLEQLDVDFYMNEKELIINSAPVTEEKFVEELKKLTDGRTEMLYHVKTCLF